MINTHSNGHGGDLVEFLVEAAAGRPINTLALAQTGMLLRREANALVDLAAELEQSAKQVEMFAANDQCRRWRAAERNRRYRARKAGMNPEFDAPWAQARHERRASEARLLGPDGVPRATV